MMKYEMPSYETLIGNIAYQIDEFNETHKPIYEIIGCEGVGTGQHYMPPDPDWVSAMFYIDNVWYITHKRRNGKYKPWELYMIPTRFVEFIQNLPNGNFCKTPEINAQHVTVTIDKKL